jgi:hypothetical protein
MLFGSVNYEVKTNAKGERLIWLDVRVVDRLTPCAPPARATGT